MGESSGGWPETLEGILPTHFARCVLDSVPRLGPQGAAWGVQCSWAERTVECGDWPCSESQESKWGGGGAPTGLGASADPRPVQKHTPPTACVLPRRWGLPASP